ncbi:30S ribosomal protein S6 [Candidatus Uhrbacteria bacterium CG_4_10_14_0_8_um_filter_58_22]|uniref:Small ribosomal subunit protein bS6 n=1 Tax=Candidatus Uhrbacteria bacterium CG_4_10_14_0_8_um_filter_58_22 TaxID=1975029 RepID=A0A2M7QB65_9BACT|nr:MAG: 30S ribosomal protein S6 [Parcubacteria group bacterium CG1_02_58_44]PIY63408.1 MAG: 30S ribosomal protein S6 [Candidatus Uhrbacteria bacterium CG_4_10_14_0_8_um_filter_58_22]
MKKYEMMFILPSKYTEGEMDGIIKKVNSMLEESGAKLADMHNLGKRRLTYPISNQRNGVYILTYFESEPADLAKMDQTIRLSGEVMRHIIIERDPHITQMPNLIEVEDRRSEEGSERQHVAAPVRAVPPKPVAKPESVNMQELDKKLDEILTEEVL